MAGLDSRAFVRRALVVASYPSNNLAHPPFPPGPSQPPIMLTRGCRAGGPCPAAFPPLATEAFQVEPPDCSTHALASSSPPRVQYLPWALLGKEAGDIWPPTRIVYVPTSIPSASRWTSTSTSENSSQHPKF